MTESLKVYDEVQTRKMLQFHRGFQVMKFLSGKEDDLIRGLSYRVMTGYGDTVDFDWNMYLGTRGMVGKLFSQLSDLGLGDEIKELMGQTPDNKLMRETSKDQDLME